MEKKIVVPYAPILVESTRSIGYSFEAAVADKGFAVVRQCLVKTSNRRPAKRCLLTFCRSRATSETSMECLADGAGRSEWYSELTRDFYLW